MKGKTDARVGWIGRASWDDAVQCDVVRICLLILSWKTNAHDSMMIWRHDRQWHWNDMDSVFFVSKNTKMCNDAQNKQQYKRVMRK